MLYIKDCVKSTKNEIFLKSQVQSNIKHQIAKHPLSISLIEFIFLLKLQCSIIDEALTRTIIACIPK